MSEGKPILSLDRPAIYQIKVPGALDVIWLDLDGEITDKVEQDGKNTPTSTLTGSFDQPALHALLRRLYYLGIPLISVICVDVELD